MQGDLYLLFSSLSAWQGSYSTPTGFYSATIVYFETSLCPYLAGRSLFQLVLGVVFYLMHDTCFNGDIKAVDPAPGPARATSLTPRLDAHVFTVCVHSQFMISYNFILCVSLKFAHVGL